MIEVNFSPYYKRNLLRILPFGIFWLVFALSYALVEKGLLGDLQFYPATGNPYNFGNSILILLSLAFLMGIGIGTLEILYLSKRFTRQSLLYKILFKTSIYLLLIVLFLLISASLTNAHDLEKTVFDAEVLGNVAAFAGNFAFLSIVLFIALIILVSLFYAEVSENIGQQVLINFLTGKYHQPIQEERIFMFLDMKSSTAIAGCT